MTRPIVLMHSDEGANAAQSHVPPTAEGMAAFVHTRSRADAVSVATRVSCSAIVLNLAGDANDAVRLLDTFRRAGYSGRVLVLLPEVNSTSTTRLLRAGGAGVLPSANSAALVFATLHELLSHGPVLPDDSPDCRLNDRERTVLKLVWDGRSNKEIAAHLNCSVSLVKASLQRMFHKTGARTRTQLMRRAIEAPNWLVSLLAAAVICYGGLGSFLLS